MTPDIQILSIVQIALIGILVVLGMFFLWRKIQRLETKMEALEGQLSHYANSEGKPESGRAATLYATQAAGGDNGDDEDEEYEYDEAMFGLNEKEEAIVERILQGSGAETGANGGAFMFFSPFGGSSSVPVVHIEDVDANADAKEEEEDKSGSEAPTQTTMTLRPASRSRLARMNVEQLKTYLAQYQLSTDGTKKQLLERAMETVLTL